MTAHIPEPMFDLRAQAQALLDPEARRSALLVTEPRVEFTAGLLDSAQFLSGHADGAALFLHRTKFAHAPSALAAFERHGLRNEALLARILGYSAPKDTLRGLQRVLQVKRFDGAVLWEQIVDNACVDAAWQAGLEHGGDLEIVHPCDCLIRRLQMLKKEDLSWPA